MMCVRVLTVFVLKHSVPKPVNKYKPPIPCQSILLKNTIKIQLFTCSVSLRVLNIEQSITNR